MLLDYLIYHPWLSLAVWAVIYTSDYTLTIIGARLYQQITPTFQIEGSYELTPVFQKDIDRLRVISPRFIIFLCVYTFTLWMAHMAFVTSEDKIPIAYEIWLGYLYLMEVLVHLRHFRNIVSFSLYKRPEGIERSIKIAKWLSYTASAWELGSFSVLFGLSFLFTGRWFFVGGVVSTLLIAYKHLQLAKKSKVSKPVDPSSIPDKQETAPVSDEG